MSSTVMPIYFMWTVRYGMKEKDEHAKKNMTSLRGRVFRFGFIQNCEKMMSDDTGFGSEFKKIDKR